ncbi:MAG: PTS sugar transporter subunit IIA [Lactobacillus sp.]
MMQLDERLGFVKLDLGTSKAVESYLANQLLKYGYVKDTYKTALLDREKEFPTGLPSATPAVAIPHANADLVYKTTIAVATLKHPVNFKNMGAITEDVPVEIVIMLVISEPHSQVSMLQKVVEIAQNPVLKAQLLQAKDRQTLIKLVETAIN